MKKFDWTPEKDQMLTREIKTGHSCRYAAAMFGCHEQTVLKRARQLGLQFGAVRKKKKKTAASLNLEKVANRAAELGMSYGYYVLSPAFVDDTAGEYFG